jgi:hypothetical protein
MVSGVELRDYLDFAAQTAYVAGRIALSTTRTLLPEVLHLIRGQTDEGRRRDPAPQT